MNKNRRKWLVILIVIIIVLALGLGLGFGLGLKNTDTHDYFNENFNSNTIINGPDMPIPKIIHQTWKTTELPENFQKWSETIKDLHRPENGWQYKLWTDKDNRNFIKNYYPWFLPIYDNYDVNIKRVDAVRYFYLYHFGGVYMDLDFASLKKLDPILTSGLAIFGYQFKNIKKEGSIANAFMAAPPRHKLFKKLIEGLKDTQNKPVLEATGPNYLTSKIRSYVQKNTSGFAAFPLNIKVYPMPIIYTREWDDPKGGCEIDECKILYPEAFTTTFWTGTWLKK